MHGGCTCRHVRYRLTDTPLFVHCCHCSWCQRESGSAFAVNVLIEASNITIETGHLSEIKVPSPSGKGQTFARCPECQIALWSYYGGSGRKIAFVRGGTLDDPGRAPPDIHIYTASKQPYVVLPRGIPCKSGYYDRIKLWPEASLKRRKNALNRL